MTFISNLYQIRKRLKEKEFEKAIVILEDERTRRNLRRDDEVLKKDLRKFKNV